MALAGGEQEPKRTAVGEHMDLGGQSTSRTPQSLILVLLFRLLPDGVRGPRCCRASVIGCPRSLARSSKTRSHTFALDQREKRLYSVFHLPQRSGRSCQCAPDRSSQAHRTGRRCAREQGKASGSKSCPVVAPRLTSAPCKSSHASAEMTRKYQRRRARFRVNPPKHPSCRKTPPLPSILQAILRKDRRLERQAVQNA